MAEFRFRITRVQVAARRFVFSETISGENWVEGARGGNTERAQGNFDGLYCEGKRITATPSCGTIAPSRMGNKREVDHDLTEEAGRYSTKQATQPTGTSPQATNLANFSFGHGTWRSRPACRVRLSAIPCSPDMGDSLDSWQPALACPSRF
jgi:hypothetical protein